MYNNEWYGIKVSGICRLKADKRCAYLLLETEDGPDIEYAGNGPNNLSEESIGRIVHVSKAFSHSSVERRFRITRFLEKEFWEDVSAFKERLKERLALESL